MTRIARLFTFVLLAASMKLVFTQACPPGGIRIFAQAEGSSGPELFFTISSSDQIFYRRFILHHNYPSIELSLNTIVHRMNFALDAKRQHCYFCLPEKPFIFLTCGQIICDTVSFFCIINDKRKILP